jgi:tripartite-type tricarboxylate transporter receptor subunit TctC
MVGSRARRVYLAGASMRAHWSWFKFVGAWLLAHAVAAAAMPARAEDYPARPVKIISDSAPGSAIDVTLRIMADRLGQVWGQQVLAVNQPGAGGAISARVAAEAAPDGYTLYMPALSVFLAVPGKAANLPLELPRDFLPIGFVAENPMFITAAPSLGVTTLPELIALAKKRPGEISYAVTGVGRLTHLTGELLQRRAGIRLLMVPYSGGPSHALNDIIGGRIPVIIEAYSGLAGAIQAGQLKVLAIASPQRLSDFPDLPTAAETIPGFAATGWQVMVTPVGTAEAIVRKVSEDLRKVVSEPELNKQFAKRGAYTRPMSPSEVTAFIQGEQRTWNPILEQIAPKP